jgi:hypothetical protein
MARDQLHTASDHLADAAAATDDEDAADRLADLADQLDSLAESDHGPDHGRMARIQTALGDLQGTVTDDVAEAIAAADDAIVAYRETVEGV